ncbi:MAG: CoA transferase, partial [Burkholderiales bacterium]|nr:CoA transferase [Burkholderiales bacterium]
MKPLEGITVVALEHAIAAPFCSRQLADQGARVIKVERPTVGDFARGYDSRVNSVIVARDVFPSSANCNHTGYLTYGIADLWLQH